METNNITKEVQLYNSVLETIQGGGKILQANQIRVNKILASAKQILAMIDAGGGVMTAELDAVCEKFLVNEKIALEQMKAAREPVTQIVAEITKLFTSLENAVNAAKGGDVAAIQEWRNKRAAQVKAEEETRREQAERKAAKAREAIDLQARIEQEIGAYFADYLVRQKTSFQTAFNNITLDNIDAKAAGLQRVKGDYPSDYHQRFTFRATGQYHTGPDIEAMRLVIVREKFPEFSESFTKSIADQAQYLLDRIPAKREELQEVRAADRRFGLVQSLNLVKGDEGYSLEGELLITAREILEVSAEEWAAVLHRIQPAVDKARKAAEEKRLKEEVAAKSSKAKRELEEKRAAEGLKTEQHMIAAQAEKERLAKEKTDREKQESDRIAREGEKARADEQLRIDSKKAGAEALALFDKEADMAVLDEGTRKDGLQIKILHPAAYVQIFQFWWERAGKNLTSDKIENTRISQMIAFAEKTATKDGELISSKLIKYDEVTKAVNKREKKEEAV